MADVLDIDWLGACRAAARGLDAVLRATPDSRDRVLETGTRGGGGDRTLLIDADAEAHVFAELERLHDAGARFTAISEERGRVDLGSDQVLVIVDPLDGSLNAKRGIPHHAISIAVADGPTMADVALGYVYDYGPGEEWRAVRGGGAFLDDVHIDDPPPERRTSEGKLELVAVESAHPHWLARASPGLLEHVHRVRAMGSLAISMCQVATTRADGMASLWRTRSVDTAAAQLIVRESGGVVAYTWADDPLAAPLEQLEPRHPVIAARSQEALERLASLVPEGAP